MASVAQSSRSGVLTAMEAENDMGTTLAAVL